MSLDRPPMFTKRLNADFFLGQAGGNPVGPITATGYLSTRQPTVCRKLDRRDREYYCILSENHEGRHRYGVVIEGSWRAVSSGRVSQP